MVHFDDGFSLRNEQEFIVQFNIDCDTFYGIVKFQTKQNTQTQTHTQTHRNKLIYKPFHVELSNCILPFIYIIQTITIIYKYTVLY